MYICCHTPLSLCSISLHRVVHPVSFPVLAASAHLDAQEWAALWLRCLGQMMAEAAWWLWQALSVVQIESGTTVDWLQCLQHDYTSHQNSREAPHKFWVRKDPEGVARGQGMKSEIIGLWIARFRRDEQIFWCYILLFKDSKGSKLATWESIQDILPKQALRSSSHSRSLRSSGSSARRTHLCAARWPDLCVAWSSVRIPLMMRKLEDTP